jgi:hypothetical protein
MNFRRTIHRRIRHQGRGVNVAGDLNAAVSATVNEPGSTNVVSSRTRTRIVQTSGRLDVSHESSGRKEGR